MLELILSSIGTIIANIIIFLSIPFLWLVFKLSPFGLTATISIAAVLVIPIGGFALMGIADHSLFTFLRLYRKWRKNRSVLLYRGDKKITYKEMRECLK